MHLLFISHHWCGQRDDVIAAVVRRNFAICAITFANVIEYGLMATRYHKIIMVTLIVKSKSVIGIFLNKIRKITGNPVCPPFNLCMKYRA